VHLNFERHLYYCLLCRWVKQFRGVRNVDDRRNLGTDIPTNLYLAIVRDALIVVSIGPRPCYVSFTFMFLH
jgi:hypothetical protein